jgi:hypothetical protein
MRQTSSWIYCGDRSHFDMHEILAKTKSTCCGNTFDEIDKVALCGCTYVMRTEAVDDHEKMTSVISAPSGQAKVIEPLVSLQYLSFKIE